MEALESILGFFSPLPASLLFRLLTIYRSPITKRVPDANTVRRRRRRSKKNLTALERETGFALEEWQRLEQDFRPIRINVFRLLDPLVRAGQLTTPWLLEALSPPTRKKRQERVPPATFAEWKERGFIDVEQSQPDPHKAAALLIAREIVNLIDPDRERWWLPQGQIDLTTEAAILQKQFRESLAAKARTLGEIAPGMETITLHQARVWRICWRWDAPTERGLQLNAPRSCLFPPPFPLARGTVVGSGWMGEVWGDKQDVAQEGTSDEDEKQVISWKRVNNKGLVSWYNGGVTFDDLVRWIPESEAFSVPMGMAPDLVNKFSDIVLNKLGDDLLSRSLSSWSD